MRKRVAFLVLIAVFAVSVAASAPMQNFVSGVYFTDTGGNNATATIAYTRVSDNETLQYQFTTSDTVEYFMNASTFSLGTNTLTANSTVYTFPAATAAVSIGDFVATWAQGATAADAVDTQFFIADKIYTVKAINVSWGVAESTGSMAVMAERLQGTEACTAGNDLQAAVVDATATANTVTTPALTATTAFLTLAAGDRLCVNLTATPDEVANLVVSVVLGAG